MHGAARLHCRDGEKAFVSVNGDRCWKEKFKETDGVQVCGKDKQWYSKDMLVAVECEEKAVDGKLTVRVYSDLSSGPLDESFAIDNVVIAKISPYAGAWCYVCKSFLCVTRTGKPTLASTYSHPIIQSMV